MSKPLVERFPYAKVVTVLASVFGVALGLCGVTWIASTRLPGDGSIVMTIGFLELAVIVLSSIGLVVTVIAWILANAFGNFTPGGNDPQKLFDSSADDERSDEEDRDR